MLNFGKINILTLVLSEKKFLNETKNHKPPPPQVKWSVPNVANIIHMSISVSQRSNIICLIFQIIATLFNKLYVRVQ